MSTTAREWIERARRAQAAVDALTATKPDDCTCRDVLVDYVRRTIAHPYVACAHYGTTTPFDEGPPSPSA